MGRGTRSVASVFSALRPSRSPEAWLGSYVGLLGLCAIGTVAFVVVGHVVGSPAANIGAFQWPALILLLGVGMLAERHSIKLSSGMEISAGFLAFFLAAAIVGPLGAIIVAVVCQVWALRKAGWLQISFVASSAALVSGCAAMLYWATTTDAAASPLMIAGHGLAVGMVFHLLNYLVLIPVGWLRRGATPLEVWHTGFQPFLVFHFFFLVLVLGLVSIYRANVPVAATGPTLYSTLLVVLCVVPVVGLIYAFKAYARQRELAVRNARLAVRNERLALEAVASHVVALDLKDDYTAQHSAAVAQWATDIAQSMRLPEAQVQLIHLAGLLHDVGKIGMPDELLKSPRHPDAEDWALIESHCFHGHKILSRMGQFQKLADVVLHHHERYDGNGYPHGLRGQDIPLESRIIAAADSYSAMISERPYGPPLSTLVAEAELEFRKGTQFDPEVVDYFLQLLHDRGEAYRLGMKADFRMEVQDVTFLRDLPVEPEGTEEPPRPTVRVAQDRKDAATAPKGELAWEARQKARQRAGRHN